MDYRYLLAFYRHRNTEIQSHDSLYRIYRENRQGRCNYRSGYSETYSLGERFTKPLRAYLYDSRYIIR